MAGKNFTQILIYFSKPLRLLYSLIINEIVNFSFFALYSLLLHVCLIPAPICTVFVLCETFRGILACPGAKVCEIALNYGGITRKSCAFSRAFELTGANYFYARSREITPPHVTARAA